MSASSESERDDPSSRTEWFVILELALQRGDDARAAEARDRLQALGVDRVLGREADSDSTSPAGAAGPK